MSTSEDGLLIHWAVQTGIGAGLTALTGYIFSEAGWDGSIELDTVAGLGAAVGVIAYAVNTAYYHIATLFPPSTINDTWKVLAIGGVLTALYPACAALFSAAANLQGDAMTFTIVAATVAGLMYSAALLISIYCTHNEYLKKKQERQNTGASKPASSSTATPANTTNVTSTANVTGNENPLFFSYLGINSDPTTKVEKKSFFSRFNCF